MGKLLNKKYEFLIYPWLIRKILFENVIFFHLGHQKYKKERTRWWPRLWKKSFSIIIFLSFSFMNFIFKRKDLCGSYFISSLLLIRTCKIFSYEKWVPGRKMAFLWSPWRWEKERTTGQSPRSRSVVLILFFSWHRHRRWNTRKHDRLWAVTFSLLCCGTRKRKGRTFHNIKKIVNSGCRSPSRANFSFM